MPSLTVIVCTYNPDENVLKECLDAIATASDLFKPHEILLIDNNSPKPISGIHYMPDFLSRTKARVIREERQGLTYARMRGINDSSGELILFIDDDNFIDKNYFAAAVSISEKYPFIGSYSGRVTLVYDKEPEKWTTKYRGMLIERNFKGNHWSNLYFNNDTMPSGAGMCITREVGQEYVRLFNEGKRNFILDRSKGSLLSGGDNDLAMCACDIGKGMGLFEDLHLRHYIPPSRFTLDYLSRLAYGIYYSFAVLQYMRTGRVDKQTLAQDIKFMIRTSLMNQKERVIQKSCRSGLDDGIKFVESSRLV